MSKKCPQLLLNTGAYNKYICCRIQLPPPPKLSPNLIFTLILTNSVCVWPDPPTPANTSTAKSA